MVFPASSLDEENPALPYDSPKCLFGILRFRDNGGLLGDTFLRSAYVVYNLDNNEISLAQSNFNATMSHVGGIRRGKGSVPGTSHFPDPVQAQDTNTGRTRLDKDTGAGNAESFSDGKTVTPGFAFGTVVSISFGSIAGAFDFA